MKGSGFRQEQRTTPKSCAQAHAEAAEKDELGVKHGRRRIMAMSFLFSKPNALKRSPQGDCNISGTTCSNNSSSNNSNNNNQQQQPTPAWRHQTCTRLHRLHADPYRIVLHSRSAAQMYSCPKPQATTFVELPCATTYLPKWGGAGMPTRKPCPFPGEEPVGQQQVTAGCQQAVPAVPAPCVQQPLAPCPAKQYARRTRMPSAAWRPAKRLEVADVNRLRSKYVSWHDLVAHAHALVAPPQLQHTAP